MRETLLLAGDVGATKTKLAIFTAEGGPRKPLHEATFPSAQHSSLEAPVREFLTHAAASVDRASFGVAGPVVEGRAEITNLPWAMDETRLARALNISSVCLLNDLDAVAHAVPVMEPDDLHVLNAGRPVPHGPIAILAPGTGLGEAFLTWDGFKYRAHPSEGGHADFAPRNALEIGLLKFLQEHFDHVSYERVISGHGLPNIYQYLKESGHAEEPAWLREQLATADDATPIIANAALDKNTPNELCVATLSTIVSILGAEAGNLALKVVATGGVYLGGGIPPRILPILENGEFLEAFHNKGRLSGLMARIPVYVILNPDAALMGAARHGLGQAHA